ncbi:MAG: hypothetical protein ACLPWF_30940 [Bryobacteraceae bacterium]
MRIGSLILTCAFATLAFGQGAPTAPTATRDFSFPPVGLASSETAQLNLVNIAPASATTGAAAPSCTGTITFSDASGKTIGSPTNFTTTGSQVSSTQLLFSQLPGSATRGEFVANVQLTLSFPEKAPCALVFSLETFDTMSGVTHVYLGNSSTGTALAGAPIGLRGPIPN